jgi:hypothetical protein
MLYRIWIWVHQLIKKLKAKTNIFANNIYQAQGTSTHYHKILPLLPQYGAFNHQKFSDRKRSLL